MDAQPNTMLEREYRVACKRAQERLESSYVLTACDPSAADFPQHAERWRAVWYVQTASDGLPEMLLALSVTFPDELPSVYLTIACAKRHEGMLHLDNSRLLCTFDSTAATPNAEVPGDVVLAVVERARAILADASIGEPAVDDFADEFKAYWGIEAPQEALALVRPGDRVKRVAVFEFFPAWNQTAILFADKAIAAELWIKAVQCRSKLRRSSGLYVPIGNLGRAPYPSTNREMFERLKALDPDALRHITHYLVNNEPPTWILFSIPSLTGRALGAWAHPQPKYLSGCGSDIRPTDGISGFRMGKCPPHLELNTLNGHARLVRATVTEVTSPRLIARTQGQERERAAGFVNVVGCGSVGSFVAESLVRSGLASKLRLIDPQVLRPENVQRHYCGMSDINQAKAVAIRRQLLKHFPQLECVAINENVLNVLRRSPKLLGDASLSVFALGELAVERRLNHLYQTGSLGEGAVCFVWVEPHLVGAHAVYLGHPTEGCLECLLGSDLEYVPRIIENPSQFSLREAGCQSTYMPYGGTDVQDFVSTLTRFLRGMVGSRKNVRFTWFGDLDAARNQGVAISRLYDDQVSFTSQIYPIFARQDCGVCL
ncbi:hypothetical protein CCAX7_35440 [Capsulimonas corticalis]|uniref:Uncharacterized protein n=2 Tax=Capsulimonas corticalis TaxID=2219043 RepID=A0A402D658_9BACT|nr:hypothetical protein CCAX7_35440 [Capsulimonas corticalis]